MRAVAATAIIAFLVLAGCTGQPIDQKAKGVDFADSHLSVRCPIQIDGMEGIHAKLLECSMNVVSGAVEQDVMKCTGLAGNLGTIASNRAASLTWSYYTPGEHQFSQAWKYNVENRKSATAVCVMDLVLDVKGTYTVRLAATCYRDAKTWLPGMQVVADGCAAQDDSIKLS